MIVGHASDLHGDFGGILGSTLKPDVWVLSGDILPNKTRGKVAVEFPYQVEWFSGNALSLVEKFGATPVVVVDGNHDYADVAALLRLYGANAVNVTPEGVDVAGVRFAGFREIPYMIGEWNGECRDFSDLVNRTFDSDPEILVTHAPPAGILDDDGMGKFGHGGGIPQLTSALAYRPHRVRAHFFGHIHEQGGKHLQKLGVHFFNGATFVKFIQI